MRNSRYIESPYSPEFYKEQVTGSLASARVVVPMVLDLVPSTSVCDLGCGMGVWLKTFAEHGALDIQGFDGPWVKAASLRIPASRFRAVDLAEPLRAGRRFDLACSLEVAEHLPEEAANRFVENLTSLAPVVVFSAAIPNQGGTGHINERWQSYWADLFEKRGFSSVDYLRPRIWRDERVEWWYRQNILMFARADAMAQNPRLREAHEIGKNLPLDLVHPDLYLLKNSVPEYFSGTLKKLPHLFMHAMTRRVG
jgi:SAM-dependent methyltransferase